VTVYSTPNSSHDLHGISPTDQYGPHRPIRRPLAFPITSRERGARRERVFFGEDDDALYRDLLASLPQARRGGLLPIT